MNKLKELAFHVFEEVLATIKEKAIEFQELTDNQLTLSEMQPKVVSYQELYELCLETHGASFKEHIETYIASLYNKDLREASIDLVREVHQFSPYRNPMIIVFFAPPYYPHSSSKKAPKIVELCNHIIDIAKEKYGETLKLEPFFPGLSDMSYLGINHDRSIDALKENLPLWGNGYSIPLKTISELNIPFINIGPLGKDPHKYTERICLSYSLDKASHLIYQAVLKAFA
ncbi:hypothetical protein SAMN05660297_03254 [Natronincola peptidivorans]|uniref:Peptidase family M20/M25/M40 n=1 Tax=Natronincola peptidivorans TaxID=426128 RepID=A0A1I0GM96_9FIRM|nr:hypothetical protein SAMN05660297_03254 [Natronincola peptidivorans]